MTVAKRSSTVLALGELAGGVGVLSRVSFTFRFRQEPITCRNHTTVKLVAPISAATCALRVKGLLLSVLRPIKFVPKTSRTVVVVGGVAVVVVVVVGKMWNCHPGGGR